jgi:crotonobetaine/carnitine-CoA ligase
VIGVPAANEAGEDEVMAVIVPAGELTAEEVWEWCRGRVPAFATPRYLRFREDLPRTPSEKIQRRVLREEATTATDVIDRDAVTAAS